MSTIRRIALVYREVGTLGGIQKTAALLESWLLEWGYAVEVFTERDLGTGTERGEKLARALKEGSFDLVIDNDTYVEDKFRADISATREAGVKIVAVWHGVFSWMLALGCKKASRIFSTIQKTDAVIALSPSDEAAFRTLGCRSLCIPCVDCDKMPGFRRVEYPHRIVWSGRFVDLKRPLDAVKIIEKVRQNVADAELEMLGDGDPEVVASVKRYLAPRPQLSPAVRLRGFVKDVAEHLKNAGCGLVTSMVEGCPHSIIEMKMASLPVVSYAMPYLVSLKDGSGAVQVPQGDVDAAAAEIVKLFSDGDLCARQGRMARCSYEELAAFDHRKSYERLFADLAKPQGESSLLSVDPVAARNAMRVLIEHAQMGFTAVKERMKEQARDNESRKGPIGAIGRFLIKVGRRLARP